ncbi:hypothetical protein DXG03_002503 [Asterophora parasitica]|uniref:Uncharacterized protein n=1 Tax=Asterophora parasitica TaxID=117018 RepID=A0A9P7G4D0_9AGAR|nr:hypothetical protein DXG03_002503 [Asterophora parasitica]
MILSTPKKVVAFAKQYAPAWLTPTRLFALAEPPVITEIPRFPSIAHEVVSHGGIPGPIPKSTFRGTNGSYHHSRVIRLANARRAYNSWNKKCLAFAVQQAKAGPSPTNTHPTAAAPSMAPAPTPLETLHEEAHQHLGTEPIIDPEDQIMLDQLANLRRQPDNLRLFEHLENDLSRLEATRRVMDVDSSPGATPKKSSPRKSPRKSPTKPTNLRPIETPEAKIAKALAEDRAREARRYAEEEKKTRRDKDERKRQRTSEEEDGEGRRRGRLETQVAETFAQDRARIKAAVQLRRKEARAAQQERAFQEARRYEEEQRMIQEMEATRVRAELEEYERRRAEERARREEDWRRLAQEKALEAELAERQRDAEELARRRMLEEEDFQRRRTAEEFLRQARQAAGTAAVFEMYDAKWKELKNIGIIHANIPFPEFPWPLLHAITEPNQITPEAVELFLARRGHHSKTPRENLKAEILKWHPDKFAGQLTKVLPEHREAVREGGEIVARCLNILKERVIG